MEGRKGRRKVMWEKDRRKENPLMVALIFFSRAALSSRENTRHTYTHSHSHLIAVQSSAFLSFPFLPSLVPLSQRLEGHRRHGWIRGWLLLQTRPKYIVTVGHSCPRLASQRPSQTVLSLRYFSILLFYTSRRCEVRRSCPDHIESGLGLPCLSELGGLFFS